MLNHCLWLDYASNPSLFNCTQATEGNENSFLAGLEAVDGASGVDSDADMTTSTSTRTAFTQTFRHYEVVR